MKSKFMCVGLLVALTFCLTGCVKFNTNMNIHMDKSMDFEMIYAVDTSLFGNEEFITAEEKNKIEEKGFKIDEYNEGSMSGVKLTSKIKNIDEISTTEDTMYNLSGILNEDDKYLFKVKKGLFRNIYSAKLKFNTKDSSLSSENENSNSLDLSNYMSNLDLSMSVRLPYKAISSNATSVLENNKLLTWKLSAQNIQYIEFEFALYNMTTIFAGIGIIVLLFILIIVGYIKINKNIKHENSNVPPVVLNNDPNLDSIKELETMNLGEAPEVKGEPIIPKPVLNTNQVDEVKEVLEVEEQFNVNDVFNLSSIPQDGLVHKDNNNNK